ncbi:MAG: hypothetical protein U0V74_09715 [Chitinophagales bacterium]
MSEEKPKSSKGFWIVFALLIGVAAVATIGNISEYRKMDRLESEGKRKMCAVDSISVKGTKREIFINLQVEDKQYRIVKKVKDKIAVGDSVAVYYMPEDPNTNGVAAE